VLTARPAMTPGRQGSSSNGGAESGTATSRTACASGNGPRVARRGAKGGKGPAGLLPCDRPGPRASGDGVPVSGMDVLYLSPVTFTASGGEAGDLPRRAR